MHYHGILSPYKANPNELQCGQSTISHRNKRLSACHRHYRQSRNITLAENGYISHVSHR